MDLGDIFYYDETSPSCLRWKVDRYSGKDGRIKLVVAGDRAGSITTSGYWEIRYFGKRTSVHRIVWSLFNGGVINGWIDHINRNKSDNRLSNLRVVSVAQNSRNCSMHKSNKSGVTGVHFKNVEGQAGYWVASWTTLQAKIKTRTFSVKKYGEQEAFRMACEARKSAINSMNEKGAGYSYTHGECI